MQVNKDIYLDECFSKNDSQRLMIKCEKKEKIIDLLTRLRKKKISMPKELNLYRVRYDGKQ